MWSIHSFRILIILSTLSIAWKKLNDSIPRKNNLQFLKDIDLETIWGWRFSKIFRFEFSAIWAKTGIWTFFPSDFMLHFDCQFHSLHNLKRIYGSLQWHNLVTLRFHIFMNLLMKQSRDFSLFWKRKSVSYAT